MKKRKRLSFGRMVMFWALVAAVGLVVTPVIAQDNGESELFSADEIVTEGDLGPDVELEESFGQNNQVTWITASDFTPLNSSVTYRSAGAGYRSLTAGTFMEAGIRLPSGAMLLVARLYYFDNDAARDPVMFIDRMVNPNTTVRLCSLTPPGGTPGFTNSASGCTALNQTIANANNTYIAFVGLAGTAGLNLRFKGVRLFWRRQIRNGLAHPFTDIGSLPAVFRNSIAAMAASGITTGTSPTTFSPNNPVTRAQMAVFLARALGLYWAYPTY